MKTITARAARITLLAALLPVAPITPAAEWRLLAASGNYQSMIDIESILPNPGIPQLRFTLRRAYHAAQTLPAGHGYRSVRVHYVADCAGGRLAPTLTAYYGDDYRLVHSEQHPPSRMPQLAAPGASDAAEALAFACQRIAEASAPAMPRVEMNPAPGPSARGNTSGSGIIVSDAGQILTNHHVVQACDAHEVVDEHNVAHKATLQAADTQRDLALLHVNKRFANVARVRADIAPKPGEAVAVVGYPLGTLLGSKPTVGFGYVSAATGVRDDPAQMQISVPIQRGNSGGPVFDQAGNVIGVVAAKLDALKIAESMGDLPQNVNFAIRGEVMRWFLEDNRVNIAVSRDSAKLENTEIARQGASVTVRVRCLRHGVTPAAVTP